MKTFLDFQEKAFEAGDILAELVTNEKTVIVEFEESLVMICCKLRIEEDTIKINYYKDADPRKFVFCCDCALRQEVQDKLYDYLTAKYENNKMMRLTATIANAQAEIAKLQSTIHNAESEMNK